MVLDEILFTAGIMAIIFISDIIGTTAIAAGDGPSVVALGAAVVAGIDAGSTTEKTFEIPIAGSIV